MGIRNHPGCPTRTLALLVSAEHRLPTRFCLQYCKPGVGRQPMVLGLGSVQDTFSITGHL